MDDLISRDLAVLWHPCSQMRDYRDFPPYEVVGAEGPYIELGTGQRVVDAISSWWCKSLGHGHPHLRQALIDQANSFEHVILANTTNRGIVRLCERLLSLANGYTASAWNSSRETVPYTGHYGKVFLAESGSTGMEIAIKMALQAQSQLGRPQRTRFAALQNGYHGETLATLSVGDCGLYSSPYQALMFPVEQLGPLPYRSGPDDPDWHNADAAWPAIEAQLNAHAEKWAAIVYEPILQAAGGMRFYSPELLRRLRRWADAHDVYLIADEIAAGMGRCGTMLASHHAAKEPGPWQDHAGCLADFAVVSKGLTGGMIPLSACLTTDAIYQAFDSDYCDGKAFLHSNTYTGNALAIAVANAALDVYADDGVLEQAQGSAARIREHFATLIAERRCLRNWRGCGMAQAVDLCAPDGSPLDRSARTGYHLFQAAIRHGAWLRPLGDTIYSFPPLLIDDDAIDQIFTALRAALDELHLA